MLAFAALAVVGYASWQYQTDGAAPAGAPTAPATRTLLPPATAVSAPLAAGEERRLSGPEVERLTLAATGGDASKRATAITALAQAPVEQALPVLRRVLMNGEPTVDRPLALQSLRDLALSNGDPQSAIRNAIREAIYHGDDQTMAADAQEALDVIEESLLK